MARVTRSVETAPVETDEKTILVETVAPPAFLPPSPAGMVESAATGTVSAATEPVGSEDRTFRVIKGQFGPWNAAQADGCTFSESQFKSVTALPISIKDPAKAGIDVDTYWKMLLERAIKLGVIRYEPGLKVAEVPLGPECKPRDAALNPLLLASIEEAVEQQMRAGPNLRQAPTADVRRGTKVERFDPDKDLITATV